MGRLQSERSIDILSQSRSARSSAQRAFLSRYVHAVSLVIVQGGGRSMPVALTLCVRR